MECPRFRGHLSAVVERPEPLKQLDRYFAAATIAHEYIADLASGAGGP
jgi:hypothetical protein